VTVETLHRSLDQELVAILRGASLECPVCGEFLLHRVDGIGCPECQLEIGHLVAGGGLELRGEAVALEHPAEPAL
jgi:Zn finger protein HypA/HybF involved in hydrogenase expression